MKIIFVVEMLKNNTREQHSYVTGVYDNELEALTEAISHMKYRGQKYGSVITGHELNGGSVVYKRVLNQWDDLAGSSVELANKVKEKLDAEERNE
jgi:aspartyl-tRNA synthetase